MKLRNKKTGKIVDFGYLQSDHIAPLVLTTYENDKPEMYKYNSLAELEREWEDYEEPKIFYWIDYDGKIYKAEIGTMDRTKIKEIGNYFETKEEAEQAVKKLKAWKRLKEAGFYFTYDAIEEDSKHKFILRLECEKGKIMKSIVECKSLFKDLKFLFGDK